MAIAEKTEATESHLRLKQLMDADYLVLQLLCRIDALKYVMDKEMRSQMKPHTLREMGIPSIDSTDEFDMHMAELIVSVISWPHGQS